MGARSQLIRGRGHGSGGVSAAAEANWTVFTLTAPVRCEENDEDQIKQTREIEQTAHGAFVVAVWPGVTAQEQPAC